MRTSLLKYMTADFIAFIATTLFAMLFATVIALGWKYSPPESTSERCELNRKHHKVQNVRPECLVKTPLHND